MPRSTKPSGKSRHDPLHVQLDDDQLHAKYGRISKPGKRKKSRKSQTEGEENGEVILDPKTSRRIFELAKDQQDELGMPDDEEIDPGNTAFSAPRSQSLDEDDEDDEDEDREVGMDADEDVEQMLEIDAGDMDTLDALLPKNAGERKTLADIIFAKLESGETQNGVAVVQKAPQNGEHPDPSLGLDPKVVETYKTVGFLMSKYKSGKLPKVFKIIPSLPMWSRMLALTHPDNWTPHACRAATKIFISNMKPPQAQLFLEVVLLDAIREDIQANKKLNVQYYECLKRALYKPGAFFKAIVFPMLDSGCTLKEAVIIASVLSKNKVPVVHSAAALMRIANMEYSGPNSLFIRILIDKKHQLPYKVVDALVFHFIRLSNTYKARRRGDAEKLPVLWHQSLLSFCQRYSADLTPDQKDALLDVVRANPHPQIGPEVRRELVNSVARGEARPDADPDVQMSL